MVHNGLSANRVGEVVSRLSCSSTVQYSRVLPCCLETHWRAWQAAILCKVEHVLLSRSSLGMQFQMDQQMGS